MGERILASEKKYAEAGDCEAAVEDDDWSIIVVVLLAISSLSSNPSVSALCRARQPNSQVRRERKEDAESGGEGDKDMSSRVASLRRKGRRVFYFFGSKKRGASSRLERSSTSGIKTK